MLVLGLEGWKKLINLVQLKSLLYLSEALCVAISEDRIDRAKIQQNSSVKHIQLFTAKLLYSYRNKKKKKREKKKVYISPTAITQDSNG